MTAFYLPKRGKSVLSDEPRRIALDNRAKPHRNAGCTFGQHVHPD